MDVSGLCLFYITTTMFLSVTKIVNLTLCTHDVNMSFVKLCSIYLFPQILKFLIRKSAHVYTVSMCKLVKCNSLGMFMNYRRIVMNCIYI
jgi:hypothetical protein